MRIHLAKVALLAALALPLALPGCGSSGQTGSGGPGGASAGNVPPEFNREITALDGSKTTLAKYQGKVVLVNFWATWCEPCRGEIPWFIDFQNKYGPEGLVIVGIAMDEEGRQVVEPWIAKERFEVNGTPEPINYEILLGTDNLAERFGGLIGMPTSMVYARDGKKVRTFIGVVKEEELTKILDTLL